MSPAGLKPDGLKLDAWIPVRVHCPAAASDAWAEWCLIGDEPFTEPYFAETLQRHMGHPFHHLFRRRTPMRALMDWREERPGAPLAGVIFHMSRCGSTLLSRMLGAVEENIVVSEAEPLEAILRGFNGAAGEASDEPDRERVEWLRGMVSALGWRRSSRERRLVLKLDAWSVTALPAIERAFPAVPWVFLYRDPVEALASHIRSPGGWTIPSVLPPAALGLEREAGELSWLEYRVRVLARVCELALRHRDSGRGMFLNYEQLPGAAWTVVARHFGIELSDGEVIRMRETARQDAHRPGIPFLPRPEREATAEERRLVARWLAPLYDKLEGVNAAAAG